MVATHGTISSFDNSVEDCRSYTERFGHYCEANSITTDTQKRAGLLSACGPKTYQLIRNVVSPAKHGEKGFCDIIDLVTRHYSPNLPVSYRDSNSILGRGRKMNQ